MSSNTFRQSPFLPTTRVFSDDDDEFLVQLTSLYTDLANATNVRSIGIYNLEEVATGEKWYSATVAQQLRQGYRKVFIVPTTPIAGGGSVAFAHGINNPSMFTRIYGVATTAIDDFRPIPFAPDVPDNYITLFCNSTVITLINGPTAPTIDYAFVVLEYLYN